MSSFALLKHWYDEVWNKANASFIDEGMHRDVIIHGLDPTGTTKGIEHFKTFYSNFRETFPDILIVLSPLVSDADTTTVHCQVTARHADGKEVHFTGLSVGRFRDGKLTEGWNTFDFLKMYQQLGHILVSQIK